MKSLQRVSRWLFGLALFTGVLWTSGIGAKEPVQNFLDGLRQRKYFDTAQEYLESLRTSPLVDAATKELIPYEQGLMAVERSKNEAVAKERLILWKQARGRFNEFLNKSPNHELAGMARIQLGDVLVERARAMVDQARKPKNADNKDAILAEARKEFKAARTVLEKAVKEFERALDQFAKFIPKDQQELRRKKNAVRRDLIQARFNLGYTIYQHGLSYEVEASKERKQLMIDAAAAFHEIYRDYRRVLAGLIAGMWEGRCYQEMGDLPRALGLYGELLKLPDGEQPFRDLKAKVLRLAMEAWNDRRQNMFIESEKRGEAWLQKAKPGEDDSREGLAIQYLLAQAKHLILATKNVGPKRLRMEQEITKLLRKVAVHRNEFRQPAKKLLIKYRHIKPDKAELRKIIAKNAMSRRGGLEKERLLREGGGTQKSEKAVALALKWLAAHQLHNGSWSFDHHFCKKCGGKCANPGRLKEARFGATGLALMAFLGAGHTHKKGEYNKTVLEGLKWLATNIKASGQMYRSGGSMYSHGIATIALCEATAMTDDRGLRDFAKRAVEFIIDSQDPMGGGWRYAPRQRGDTSVGGWQTMALMRAKWAYIKVPDGAIAGMNKFLDTVQSNGGSRYGYTTPGAGSATTAIGLLCRMHLGWKKDNAALAKGVDFLSRRGPSKNNVYYNYYATQVLRHYGGPKWRKWNETLREQLIESQSKNGHETGSWYIKGGHGASQGGRHYTTCMCCMTLEAYYRHVPLFEKKKAEDDSNE